MNQFCRWMSTLGLIAILLAACGGAPQVAAPLSTATSLPPTAMPSTEAPTAIPTTPALTTFSSKVYKLPMTVSFGRDWHVSEDFSDLITVASNQQDWPVSFNIVTHAKLADPANGHLIPFPEDFAAWLKSNPDFNVDEPRQVMVAGINGLQIDATPVWTSTTTSKKLFLSLSSSGWNIVTNPERWRFILLNNVHGERLLVLLISPADQFDTAAHKAQTILDSVVFTK